MKDIITKQHIRRRKQSSLLSRTKRAYPRANTAGHGPSGYLIERIKQKPAPKRSRKWSLARHLPRFSAASFFFSFFPRFRLPAFLKTSEAREGNDENRSGTAAPESAAALGRAAAHGRTAAPEGVTAPEGAETSRFSFPVLPLVILGGILFFALLTAARPGEWLKGLLREANLLGEISLPRDPNLPQEAGFSQEAGTPRETGFFGGDSGPLKNAGLLGDRYFPDPPEDGMYRQSLAAYAGLVPAPEPADDRIPLDLMETFTWKSYTVKKGDSVSKIAADHAISMDAIIASNNITNARRLREGEVLRIPNMDGIPYTVARGDTLSKISTAMEVPLEAILDANDIQDENIGPGMVLFIPGAKMSREDLKLVLGELFIYPVKGRLSSPFGWRNDPISGVRRYHAALDLAANTGTPVNAALDGRISTVGFNSVYGKYIIISHNGGYQTMYAHLSLTSVQQGAYVYQGTKIGEVGNTGYSTGPHLHFAIYKNGTAVNPLDLLSRSP
jgi:murein DD-endopeptidase MepM/ murein hydrolase activator NlpD